MTTSVAVAVAAAFICAVWAACRVLTARLEGAPPIRQYLAGRRDDLQIADSVVYQDDLLVIFAADPTIGLTANTWWVANEPTSHHRLEPWRDGSTVLRAYLSADGGTMLADPIWGGNVACEPAMARS